MHKNTELICVKKHEAKILNFKLFYIKAFLCIKTAHLKRFYFYQKQIKYFFKKD